VLGSRESGSDQHSLLVVVNGGSIILSDRLYIIVAELSTDYINGKRVERALHFPSLDHIPREGE
jgi:hypothetical protein